MNGHRNETSLPRAEHAQGARSEQRQRIGAALLVTAVVLVLEVVGGLLSGSLALLADAGHMFTDVAALLLAYSAMTLAERRPTQRYTFGLHRAEILAAFINAQLLLFISAYILYEAFARFRSPTEIHPELMFVVAVIGLAANLVAIRFLHGHQHDSLNIRAAYLEVLTDALGSVAVIVAAVVIALWGWLWADLAASVGIALFIVPRAVSILRQAGHVLLEGAPRHVDLGAVRRDLADLTGVVEIHDFHCWTLTSGMDSASVHVRVTAECDRLAVRREIERVILESVGVGHVTVQLEESSEECFGPTC